MIGKEENNYSSDINSKLYKSTNIVTDQSTVNNLHSSTTDNSLIREIDSRTLVDMNRSNSNSSVTRNAFDSLSSSGIIIDLNSKTQTEDISNINTNQSYDISQMNSETININKSNTLTTSNKKLVSESEVIIVRCTYIFTFHSILFNYSDSLLRDLQPLKIQRLI